MIKQTKDLKEKLEQLIKRYKDEEALKILKDSH